MPTPETELPVLDPAELLLKQKELSLLRAKLALVKAHGLAFYRPHEKQHEFHKSAAKRRGVFAGNRIRCATHILTADNDGTRVKRG